MAVSLRIVIAVITAITVLVVAAVTLTITYTVSVNAVRDTGERLSEAISATVSLEVQGFMNQAEDDVASLGLMVKAPNVTFPSDHPDFNTPGRHQEWAKLFQGAMRSMLMRVNYTFTSTSMIFLDGSGAVSLSHPFTPGWFVEAAQSWDATTNTTRTTETAFHTVTRQDWWDTPQGRAGINPAAGFGGDDGSLAGIATPVINFVGRRDTCIWFPPGVDTNSADRSARFILYGACTLFNNSDVLLGTANIGIYLDRLPEFLRGTSKTENTHLMLVDNFRLMLGSTYHVPFVEFGAPGELRQRANCISSEDTSPPPVTIGCRSYAETYPYAPMQDMMATEPALLRAAGTNIRFGKLDGKNYYYISQRIPTKLGSYTINLVTFMPESDVLGDIVAGRNLAIGISCGVFVVAVIISTLIIGGLLAPIDDIARRMYFTSQLTSEAEQHKKAHDRSTNRSSADFDDIKENTPDDAPLKASSMAEVRALQSAYTTMDTAIKSFTRYVPRDVVKELMTSNQMCEIAMRPMRCSMLFTDIAGFTSICERVPPHILSGLVQLYFERSSRIVMGHGGVIDKFIGDCIMAVWGAPVPIDHHEIRSAVCGHMLVHETNQDPLKGRFADAGEALAIRVGVATGEVLAGNMGSDARMNYTVIGDDVNLASRLEALNKQWGTSTFISEETAEECASHFHLRYVISIAVVGKQQPVKVYEVLGVNPKADTEGLGTVTTDASENVTLNQAKSNEALQEMQDRYGMADNSKGELVLSTGKLLRRALRKHSVPEEELLFAQLYTDALAHWNRGDFGACIAGMQALTTTPGLPENCAQRLSVTKVLAAAEENLKAPPAGEWTGVWTALEK